MKKSKFLITASLSVALLLSVSACGHSTSGGSSTTRDKSQTDQTTKSTNTDKSSTSNNATSNNSTSSSTKSSDTNANSSNKNQVSNEVFYGTWNIKKIVASGSGGGTYSSNDIKALEGKQLTFSKDSATCFGDNIEAMKNTVSNPVYKKTTVSKDDFESDFKMSFVGLEGIEGNSITEVDVTGTCSVFFITPDNNKLLLYGGGNLFELQRANQTIPKSNATNRPSGAWVDAFEKKLYEGYQVTPSRYKNIGNGLWEVWVNEVNTGQHPYVTVNKNTGNFHG